MANAFLNHLKKEHKEVLDIFEKLEKGNGNKDKLFMKLREEFLPHLIAEEKVFYAALIEKKGAREDALESYEEHHVASKLFKELEKMSQDDERWQAKLKVLKEIVTHHIEEEEHNLFKVAEKELEKDEFPTIMSNFEKQSEKVRQSLQ